MTAADLGLLALDAFAPMRPAAFVGASIAAAALAFAVIESRRAVVLHKLRTAIDRFWDGLGQAPSTRPRRGAERDVVAALAAVRAQVRERILELTVAREVALRDQRTQFRAAQRLAEAQRIAHIGSFEWDRARNRVGCSQELYRLLGVEAASFRPTPGTLFARFHPDDRRAFRRWLVRVFRGAELHGFDLRLRADDGEIRHLHVLVEPRRDDAGVPVGVAGTVQDATERVHAIHEIHRLAYYDVLTELPNRSRFHEKLSETLQAARRGDKPFALMFLDLDQFKRINDTLGHAVGDELLRIVAQRLTRVLRVADGAARGRPSDRDVCRQGGDEFIVLLNGVSTEEHAARAAARVIETLAEPIAIGGQEVFVSASIGIVLFPRDGADLDSLLKNADVAMYHAKSEGRNRYAFYQDSMREAIAARLSLERDLRRAIENEQFELHYQPQIDVVSGRVVGVEALIRWRHPTLGMLWPKHFIPVAEEAGLIMGIWEWVLVTTLMQHNAWRELGLPAVTIGVNLSSLQFSDPALAARVGEIARVVGVPLSHVELEVTESALMQDFDRALATLQALRDMGVQLAIDDFGTGYSSLSYLRRLPLDKLKLDHGFTSDAVQSDRGAAIARAIVSMAQELGLSIVAEGVETQQQIDLLVGMGCTTMQGYLLSRPIPADAMTELLRRHAERDRLPAIPVLGDATATAAITAS